MKALICLYGNNDVGAGWLAQLTDRMTGKILGDGEPKKGRSMTEAVWLAVDAIKSEGYQGVVWVYAAGGRKKAKINTKKNVGYFGDFQWMDAEVYVIDTDELELVASEQSGGVS